MQAWADGLDRRGISAATVPASPFSAQLRGPSWASAADLSINAAYLQVTVRSTTPINAKPPAFDHCASIPAYQFTDIAWPRLTQETPVPAQVSFRLSIA